MVIGNRRTAAQRALDLVQPPANRTRGPEDVSTSVHGPTVCYSSSIGGAIANTCRANAGIGRLPMLTPCAVCQQGFTNERSNIYSVVCWGGPSLYHRRRYTRCPSWRLCAPLKFTPGTRERATACVAVVIAQERAIMSAPVPAAHDTALCTLS